MNRVLFFLIILILSATACGPANVQLSRADLRLVDSLFLASRNEWSEKLKDSCTVVKEQNFDFWVDSIKEERLKEIKIMLNRHEEVQ
ncbi:MAG: hypothetical protein HKN76_19455 [Saprospiraceae bacterium]|nr:hypothetical protein [Saprospiraceae bacterium]